MTVPFAARVFALSFAPVFVLLVGSFWAIQETVSEQVKDGLRASLRQSHTFVSRVRANYELQNSRLLRVLAENPSLKAGFELVRLERNSRAAHRTLEDQLGGLSESLAFDLVAAADTTGRMIAGVVRTGDGIDGIGADRSPELGQGAVSFGDRTYVLAEIPVNLEYESLGTLFVGRVFDVEQFSTPTVLSHNGRVLQSNLAKVPVEELQTALRDCAPEEECEIPLGDETYLCLPLEGLQLGDGYLLRSLQSVDAASKPLMAVVRQVFLAAGTIALLAISLLSLVSAKGIVSPLTGLIARLKESEGSGVLPSFETSSSTREINQLVDAFNKAATAIREARQRLTFAYREFIQSLSSAIDARDVYTAGHSRRVSTYAVAIAREMKLPADGIEVLREGALLHDVGKIGISDRILQKPGNLSPEEFELIRRHPLIGRRIIERVEGLAPYLSIVEMHHENYDGTGYPWQLVGNEIPRDARIIHVADAYDAMTSDRPYRKGMTPDEAVAILKANAGTQFDPDVVAAFVRLHHRVSQDEIRRADSPYHPDLDRLSAALSKAAGEESASAVKEVLS
jgi:HD-GYP domain-containing protein (c-di-GMP phosphodiesterase class II)